MRKKTFMNKIEKTDKKTLEELIKNAKLAKRKRFTYVFNKPGDKAQKLLNAIEPESYVRSHKYLHTFETFVIIKGKIILEPNKTWLVEIPPNVIPSLVSLKSGSVLFLVMEGPYNHKTHKKYPLWAPEENTPEAKKFMLKMIKELG